MKEAARPGARSADRPSLRGRNRLSVVVFGFAAVLLYLASEFWEDLGSPWGPGVSALFAYLLFIAHILIGRRRLTAMDPVVWVPVSMLLFYFGMPVAIEVLWPGIPPDYDAWSVGRISSSLGRGYCVLLMGFAAFIWGTHLSGLQDLSRSAEQVRARGSSLAGPSLIMTLGALLMIAMGVAMVGPSVVFGYYEDWWAAKAAGADARFVDVGLIFAMSGVFGLIASDDPRQPLRRYFAFFIAALIATLHVQKGARSALIALCIGVAWCYSQRVRRIRPRYAVTLAVLVLMVLPVIKEFRNTKRIDESVVMGPRRLIAQALYEMGSSANAMVFTLELIPRSAGYSYGITYVDAFLQAIPNFGLTPGKMFVLYGIGREHLYGTRISPSAWITEQLSPDWFDNGGGYGFAMAAEFYYNFGMPAVLIGMAACGFLMGRVRNASRRSDLWLVASALLFAAMAGWVREVIGVPLKMATWPLIGLFLIRAAFQVLSRPSIRPRVAAQASAQIRRAPLTGWIRED